MLGESLSPNEKTTSLFGLERSQIFGLSPNLGLRETLSERLIQNVK